MHEWAKNKTGSEGITFSSIHILPGSVWLLISSYFMGQVPEHIWGNAQAYLDILHLMVKKIVPAFISYGTPANGL